FTITTGHQLNLFTGPLYFLYKIISTINLTRLLNKAYPEYNFVPVYWMATEDHDFDEINYFNFKGRKVQWNRDASGAVGRMDTKGLEEVSRAFASHLPKGKTADELMELFEEAYTAEHSLTQATRYLANALFGEYGLVIIDGDDNNLKRLLIPVIEKEINGNLAFKHVAQTNAELSESGYKIQVNPREINLFYLTDGLRERIIEHEGQFKVNNTGIMWDRTSLFEEIHAHPERFSPNVITRPVYQELILPNLCYIGGGGELAYWMQLRSYFDELHLPFPILLLRNSAVLVSQKQFQKLAKLKLEVSELFKTPHDLNSEYTRRFSEINIDFSAQKDHLKSQFEALYEIAEQTDKSFLGAVAAQERKQIKGLEHLEKRLLKAQKRKITDLLDRIGQLQNDLFPGSSLQERQKNFSEFYLEYGKDLIKILMNHLDPLNLQFMIIEV
ncbi:MAG: bacillithiol biosynthesis cysteine-adding enzyme BshC, partial [Flavobacteriaceae bacterium]|nr:bacillithiol biosynthesis cysteine-adding enzyme BshC [Flavobacteriaceae bacterium]